MQQTAFFAASVTVYTREDYWLNRLTDIWHEVVAAFDYLH